MKTVDAVQHFQTQARLAAALGIYQSAISQWGEHPPALRQLQIERITDGKLKAEGDVFHTPDCATSHIPM